MVVKIDSRIYLQIYYLPLPFKNIFGKQVEESSYSIEMNRQKNERISSLIAQKCSGITFTKLFLYSLAYGCLK
jgi:hypothetical protein